MPEADSPRPQSRPRAFARLLAASVLLPLAILLFGLWEMQRGDDDWADFEAQHARLSRLVTELEARMPKDGRPDYSLQFREHGQTYGGPYALERARDARDEAGTLATLMDWRRWLPPVAVIGGGIAAALSLLVLAAGALLGLLGRTSRNVLVRGFSVVRLVLPATLAIQILAATAGFVAVVTFETGMVIQDGFSADSVKLIGIALVAIGATLIAASGAVLGLRRALDAFEPDPLPILGRQITPAEAPGLWRLAEALAQRMGALKPEAVVVGLTEGFFVTAGPAVLEPSGARLTGRILYLPLPYLALMRSEETAAIIAHELGHYAGGDTAYSQRFLPIYVGVERSLDAIALGQSRSFGLLGPSFRLGLFVMERFHLAVRQWSRVREFAADAAGAKATSAEASARALLRYGATGPRIVETLNAAVEAPDAAPPDLVAAVIDHAAAVGLDDPAVHLETEQAHPTDTHPPTRQRIAALGQTLDQTLLAAAATPPTPEALEILSTYFADPAALCRAATADFLAAVHARKAAVRAHLEATAAEIGSQPRVLRTNHRSRGLVLAVAGGVFAAAALALALLGIPGASPYELKVALVTVAIIAAVFGGGGALILLRQEPISLILEAEGLKAPGLEQTIAWDDIADLDMLASSGHIVTRLLLMPSAPWPQRSRGRHGVKLDPKHRIVTLSVGLPRKMKPQDFANLIGLYQAAHQARKLLAERDLAHPAPPENHAA